MNRIFYIIIFYFCLFTPAANAQWLDAYIPDFKVNDDNLNSYQTNSQIGVDSAGNFVIVWRDVRNNPGNSNWPQVYCQRYSFDGTALGNNFRIGQDTASFPVVTMLENGRFVVSWLRHFFLNSLQRYEIYYQRFTPEGIGVSMPLRVVDTSFSNGNELFSGLDISSDSTGNFVICWSKKPDINNFPVVYLQRFDSSGSRFGGVEAVNEPGYAQFPSVACNKDGSFVIVWQDDKTPPLNGYDIYMQRYNTSGIKIGNNVKVNDDNTNQIFRGGAHVTTDGYGYTVIVWLDPRICGFGEVYYQLYSSLGGPLGVNRKANSSPCGDNVNSSVVSMRTDKKFFIGWSDWFYSGREQFYGRRFDSSGAIIGSPYMIPAISPGVSTQRANDVMLLGDRVYSTWHDNRNGGANNFDIYCNVRGFQNPDTVIGIISQSEVSEEFRLYSAYPNPFNPTTKIRYSLSTRTHITIKIYNILGNEVAVLVNENITAGYHEAVWDAPSFASGIYFIKMITGSGFTETQKITLLK